MPDGEEELTHRVALKERILSVLQEKNTALYRGQIETGLGRGLFNALWEKKSLGILRKTDSPARSNAVKEALAQLVEEGKIVEIFGVYRIK